MSISITIETCDHKSQRYPTVGDWQFQSPTNLTIRVSEMGNPDYEFLVAIHEALEAWIATHNGVRETDVDAFDMEFEARREPGNTDEPGDDPRCPVYNEHYFATIVERMVAAELNINWDVYNEVVEAL